MAQSHEKREQTTDNVKGNEGSVRNAVGKAENNESARRGLTYNMSNLYTVGGRTVKAMDIGF